MTERRGIAAACAALSAVAIGLVGAAGADAVRGTQFRPPVSTAKGGMVATESLAASRVARGVLARGGNAADAVVAGTFAIGVARPQSCGIGGGGFLVHRSAGGRIDSIDFREVAPAAVRPDTFAGPGPHKQFTGQRTVGVPGTVAGLAAALERHGTISLADAVAPAVALASGGVEVTASTAAELATHAPRLRRFPESARIFLGPDGAPLARGATLRQPDLARTLDGIARRGPDYFYRGPVARSIVQSMATAPQQLEGDVGLMTAEDLAAYKPTFRRPLVGTYRGHEIVTMGPPTSGGIAILQMLNLLEGTNIQQAGQSSADALHLLAETQKIAFADRNAYVGDPDQVQVPTETLISKAYADKRRDEIDPARAKTYKPGDVGAPARRTGRDLNPRASTTHLSVIDNRGNAASLTCTIEQTFGSAVVAPGTGVLLNNELTDFSDPGTANQPAPGKTPRSSMSPTIVVREGRPVLAIGGAGGARIIEGVMLGIVNLVDFGLDVAEALDAERIDAAGASLIIEEARIPSVVRDELIRRGHRLAPAGEYDARPRVNAAGFDLTLDRLLGASDPRTDAAALASGRRARGGRTAEQDARRPTVAFARPTRARDSKRRRAAILHWRARDRGTGVASAAVQVRRRVSGGGYAPWSTLAVDVTRTRLGVSSTKVGRAVQFRIRVTDRAGNVSRFDTLDYRFR
jgi:gamma-glutamyltranspeptidase/glutathione hydrolase